MTIRIFIIAILSLSLNCTYAQFVDSDPTWDYIIANNLIPVNVVSTAGIKGTKLDVDNQKLEVGLYAARPIKNDIKIHTVGNDAVPRTDFLKWTRWYQEDGNTQIFRLFPGEYNVSNDRRPAPRIEAETVNYTNGTKGVWHEWSGRYTFPKAGDYCVFQIWGTAIPENTTEIKSTGLMMLKIRPNGDFIWDRRNNRTAQQVLVSNYVGKSVDVKVRDNGLDYEIYINGVRVVQHSLERLGGCHFRWGIYGDQNVPEDMQLYISGAQVDGTDVVDVTSPKVSIVEPFNGNDIVLQQGYSLYLKANASDANGSIANVKLYIDDVFVREDSVAPYEWGVLGSSSPNELNGLALGQHTIKVVATDNDGLTNSASMKLTVKVPGIAPSISIATPTGNQNVNSGYSLYLKADASDSDGTIANVKLYIDGVFVRQESVAPYEWGHAGSPNPNELNGLAVGQHTIVVVATDSGGYTNSASMVLTVDGNLGITERNSTNIAQNVYTYPNPAKQGFTVESKDIDISEVAIYAINGKLIFQSDVQANKLLVNKQFASGLYFVKIKTKDSGTITQKLVVE